MQIETTLMNKGKDKNNSWDSFLIDLQTKGRNSFTFDELKGYFNLSEESLLQGLFRYKVKKQIAQVRKGFYAIITPKYSTQGMLPPSLFIDDLMKSLNKPYYVALLSAAATYGAAHQQPMEYFIITQTPAPRSIINKKMKIVFLSKKDWNNDGITQQKTNAGYINVSLPELTALDFFTYSHKIGINRIITVLHELVEEMKSPTLAKIAKKYTNTAAIQRLGYILETEIQNKELADKLWVELTQRKYFPVPLSPQKEKKGDMDSRWKVIRNTIIESDL